MLKLSPKILFLSLSLLIFTNQSFVYAVPFECEYKTAYEGWFVNLEGSVYYCDVKNERIFIGERVFVDSVSGEHGYGKIISNVKGLRLFQLSNVKYFPKNLENVFQNLLLIIIESASLVEIKQSDIIVFPKLQNLNLFDNKITTIDEDLFKFNPELRTIYLNYNRISHIDPNVFDHLNDLSELFLANNDCENSLTNAHKSRSDVLQLIQRVNNEECSLADVLQKKMEAQEEKERLTPNSADKKSILMFEILLISTVISRTI